MAQRAFFAEQGVDILRVLTDRGTEYCGSLDRHAYQLYLQLQDIEHTRTKARHPQTNGICERFHKTVLDEFYKPTFRKRIFGRVEELQVELDDWVTRYNRERTHQGKRCQGKTPLATFLDGIELARVANLAREEKLTA